MDWRQTPRETEYNVKAKVGADKHKCIKITSVYGRNPKSQASVHNWL